MIRLAKKEELDQIMIIINDAKNLINGKTMMDILMKQQC